MKLPTLQHSIRTAVFAATVLIAAGCNKTGSSNKSGSEPAGLSRLDWNLKTLVIAYQKAGHTSSKWDEPAKRSLTEFARVRSQSTESNEDGGLIISKNCKAAADAGCDDPMIQYLSVRFCMDQSNTKQAFVDAFCKAAVEMEKSTYPNIRKFYAWHRAGEQATYAYGYGTNIPAEIERLRIWAHAETNLLEALSDHTMPPEEAYDSCHELLQVWQGGKEHYSLLYHRMESQFPDNWTNAPLIQLLKGEAYIAMAWHARGNGYANTVTSDGWKTFADRLVVADGALTRAWQLNTNDPRAAVEMMTVQLGQGQGRDRLELWFNRAMQADTNDYDACSSKLYYLEPKWYGSVDDMLAFGRECVENKKWGGHVPLVLMDAHIAIQQQFIEDSEKTNYWKQPVVWLDLKNAFERFFELNPEEIGWYHNYAWYAYQAEQWTTFNSLIPKLAPGNYDIFGGKTNFEQMVALARDRAGETKTKDQTGGANPTP
jgi:hypothetical protein